MLRQMLVCYEFILTGESRALAGEVIGAFTIPESLHSYTKRILKSR